MIKSTTPKAPPATPTAFNISHGDLLAALRLAHDAHHDMPMAQARYTSAIKSLAASPGRTTILTNH
jgi:hypothetical protein